MHPFYALAGLSLVLYRFRFFDAASGRWVLARHRAELHVIAKRYARWQLVGEPEIRRNDTIGWFSPHHDGSAPVRAAEQSTQIEMPDAAIGCDVETSPSIVGDTERFLVLLFLRRYIAWCARRRRYASMEGAAKLSRSVRWGPGSNAAPPEDAP